MSIIDNFNRIREIINETAINCGRNPEEISIVSVSKTFNSLIIQRAIDSGITVFGENKVQEAKEKFPLLKGNFKFHMIGHLQSNKIRDAINIFELVHSIDKTSTANKLNEEAAKAGKVQKILVQLKTADEFTKHGAGHEEIISLAEYISTLNNLKLEGIMSVGPNTSDHNAIQKSFIQTAKSLDNINNRLKLQLKELSMGMSGDFTIAIKEGATIVRIGSAIFGDREYL